MKAMAIDGDSGSDSDDQLIQLDNQNGIRYGDTDDQLVLEEPGPEPGQQKKHFFWVRWICRRPKTMFAITSCFHIAVVVVSLVLFFTGYDIIHLVVKGMPVYDMNDIMYQRFLAWSRKDPNSPFTISISDMYPRKRRRRSLQDPDVNQRYLQPIDDLKVDTPLAHAYVGDIFGGFLSPYNDSSLDSLYHSPMISSESYPPFAKNLFSGNTPNLNNALSRMKRSNHPKCDYWVKQWIDLIYDTGSDSENILTPKYLKAIRKFENRLSEEFKEQFVEGISVCMCKVDGWYVDDVFDYDLAHVSKGVKSTYWLSKTATVDPATRLPHAHITRSYMRFCTSNGPWPTNAPIMFRWMNKVFLPRADELAKEILEPEGVTLSYFAFNVYTDKILHSILDHDVFLFCGSVFFIFAFMWLQTGSFWITFFGIISILTSIAAANLIYNCVIGFKLLGIFNLLSLFVVLGIGADDIFIFIDTWKWLDGKYETAEERIAVCFKKAGVAMFSTSLTTMVAFFVSSFSSLLTLSSFGTLSGLVVLLNYLSVMTFFPTVILAHEDIFGKRERSHRCASCVSLFAKSNNCMKKIHDSIVNFFGGIYFEIVTHKYGRLAIIGAFVIFTASMGLSASDLEIQESSMPNMFRKETPFEQGRVKATNEFRKNNYDRHVEVFLVWGFKPRDMSTCNPLRYDYLKPCPGKEAMDDDFELETPQSQVALLNLCQSLENANDSLVENLGLGKDPSTKKVTVACIMTAFNMYLDGVSKQVGTNLTLPLTKEKLRPVLPLLKLVGQADINLDNLTTPFQTMMWIFLEKSGYAKDLKKLAGFKDLSGSETSIGTYKGEPVYNRQLRYIAVLVPSAKSVMSIGINEGLRLMRRWESFTEREVSALPDGLKGGFQVAMSWFLLNTKERLVMNAAIGVGVSLGLAFTLLLMTTRNIILAVISLITLTATVVCVIGLMPIMNWKLGPLLALNMCFVAGLAVDYIVHVIEGFQLSDFKARRDRIQECLRHVGISIISGAITTLGSSFFMLFAEINFFMQFGWFMFFTIGTSFMFSLFFLPALLSIVGPSGDQGSLTALLRMVIRKKGSKVSDVTL